MSGTGYIVFAHGSSIETANEAVRSVAREMARRGGLATVQAAFLEGGTPDLMGAVAAIATEVSCVVVVPYFLTLGLHLQRDLPRLVEEIRLAYPGLRIDVTAPLDGHPAMPDLLLARAYESAGEPAR
jgi:sirohydrochlorin ferrochelatase